MSSFFMTRGKNVCRVLSGLFSSLRVVPRWQQALLAVFFLSLFFSSLFFSYRTFVLVYPATSEQQEVIDYLYYNGALSQEFGVREREHLLDVKKIMGVIDVLLVFLALLAVGFGMRLYSYKLLGHGFFVVGFLGIVVLLFGIIGLVFSFDLIFDLFHRFLFTSGSWMFPAQSVLIRRFPEAFFALAAKSILMLAFLLQVMFMATGVALFGKVKR